MVWTATGDAASEGPPRVGSGAPVHQRREDRQLLEPGRRGAGAESGGPGRHRRRYTQPNYLSFYKGASHVCVCVAEAQEVSYCNPWFSYCEPLHRLREFGSLAREFDMLDEKLLPMDDMRKLCTAMYVLYVCM